MVSECLLSISLSILTTQKNSTVELNKHQNVTSKL